VTAEQARTGRLLREQPTAISEIRDPREILEELRALGVVKKSAAIDVEVVDESV
jgi:hypothetical protein